MSEPEPVSPPIYVSEDPGFDGCDLYDCSDDREELIHHDPDEAVEQALDDCDLGALPETITVYGFTRGKLSPGDVAPDLMLESILEGLDEEYAGDEPTTPTPGMLAAAEALSQTILREYVVRRCEQTHKAMVNVDAWVRENRPDWLEAVS